MPPDLLDWRAGYVYGIHTRLPAGGRHFKNSSQVELLLATPLLTICRCHVVMQSIYNVYKKTNETGRKLISIF